MGLSLGKFCQFLTELSTSHIIVAGFIISGFYFAIVYKGDNFCDLEGSPKVQFDLGLHCLPRPVYLNI